MFFQKEGKIISGFVCVAVFWFFCWVNKMLSLWSEIVAYGFDKHLPYAQFLSAATASCKPTVSGMVLLVCLGLIWYVVFNLSTLMSVLVNSLPLWTRGFSLHTKLALCFHGMASVLLVSNQMWFCEFAVNTKAADALQALCIRIAQWCRKCGVLCSRKAVEMNLCDGLFV